jgi:hypothetical protein
MLLGRYLNLVTKLSYMSKEKTIVYDNGDKFYHVKKMWCNG